MTKHAITGLTACRLMGGPWHCVRADRYRQCVDGNGRADDDRRAQADGRIMVEPTMDVGDVARAVLMMAELASASNVQFMTVMATNMPFIGRG